jgi:CubicO group peptidase (beta-lactamase class C family)
MKTRLGTSLAGVWTALIFSAAFAGPDDLTRMERDTELRVSNGQFMGTVLVAKDGRPLINRGYGSANLEWKIPNSPMTKFRLGSVTKQFTAASILLLEERGKLKIQDPVKNYLPDAPAAWDQITIFNLLTHTSGIPNFTSFPDYRSTQAVPTTPEKLVARFRDKALRFEPGSSWEYSNSGYALLGYLIEKISGEPYRKFVQDNIFTPLGMKDSGYDSNTAIIDRRAVGYAPGPNGPVSAAYIDMSIPFSAGGLYSTSADLLRWEQALYGGKLLSAASLQKMTTPFRNNYAFGLMVRKAPNGDRIFSHGGGIDGFNTEVAYVPARKLAVIVLANLNGPAADEIAMDLTRVAHGDTVTLLSDRKAIKLPARELDRLLGHYQFQSGTIMAVWRDGDRFLTQIPGQPVVELYPETKLEFFARVVDTQIAFQVDDRGRVADLVLHQNGQDQTGTRMDEAAAKRMTDALNLKIKDQTPTAGSETELRRLIAELIAGTPDYERMGPEVAEATRQQLPQVKSLLVPLGTVKSVDFKGVGPGGADIFRVKFERGTIEWRIRLTDDGKVGASFFGPPQ